MNIPWENKSFPHSVSILQDSIISFVKVFGCTSKDARRTKLNAREASRFIETNDPLVLRQAKVWQNLSHRGLANETENTILIIKDTTMIKITYKIQKISSKYIYQIWVPCYIVTSLWMPTYV